MRPRQLEPLPSGAEEVAALAAMERVRPAVALGVSLLGRGAWMKGLERDLAEVDRVRALGSWDGYKDVYSGPEMTTYYKRASQDRVDSLGVEGRMQCPVFNVIALLNEVDLLPHVLAGIPGVSLEIDVLDEPSSFEKVLHVVIHTPWPLADRDMMVHIRAFDDLERGDIVFTSASIETWPNITLPPPKAGTQRIST